MPGSEVYDLAVSALPPDITEEELRIVFKTYGDVKRVKILSDPARARTGTALVRYATKKAAEDAITVLHELYKIREGADRPIKVRWAAAHAEAAPPAEVVRETRVVVEEDVERERVGRGRREKSNDRVHEVYDLRDRDDPEPVGVYVEQAQERERSMRRERERTPRRERSLRRGGGGARGAPREHAGPRAALTGNAGRRSRGRSSGDDDWDDRNGWDEQDEWEPQDDWGSGGSTGWQGRWFQGGWDGHDGLMYEGRGGWQGGRGGRGAFRGGGGRGGRQFGGANGRRGRALSEVTHGPPGAAGGNRVYLANLPGNITDGGLERICRNYGQVLGTKVIPARSGDGPSCGIVRFASAADAGAAIAALDGREDIRPGSGPIRAKRAKPNPRWGEPF